MLTAVADEGANDELLLVSLYGVVAEEAGVRVDGEPGTESYEVAWLNALTTDLEKGVMAHPPDLVGGNRFFQVIGRLGFFPSDLRAEIQVGQPPNKTTIGVVDVEESTLLDLAAEVRGATRSDVAGTEVVSWLGDNEANPSLDTPIGRVSGQAARLAMPSRRVLVHSTTDAGMTSALETANGDRPSLADHDDLRSVAAGLDDAGVFAAYLSVVPMTRPVPPSGPRPGLAAGPLLQRYTAYGVGSTLVDGDPEVVVVLVSRTDDIAAANADLFAQIVAEGTDDQSGQRWSDLLTDPRIQHQGKVVIGRFAAERPDLWSRLVQNKSSLLAVG
jgi:hypothetical protein